MNTLDLDYLEELLMPVESPVGIAVNLAILALFVVGVADVIRVQLVLVWQSCLTRLARRDLGRLVEKDTFPASGKELLHELRVSASSLPGRRIATALRLRDAGLSQHEVLRHLTEKPLARRGPLPRYIGAILTLVGLFGTVLGLSFALLSIHQALQSVGDLESLDKLVRALRETLFGMRTAFATTVAGLGAALMLSICTFLADLLYSMVSSQVRELVSFCLPSLFQHLAPDADDAAKTFSQELMKAAAELGELRQVVTAAATDYREASAETKAAGEVFKAGAEEFGQHVAGIEGQQAAFTKTLEETGTAIRSLEETSTTQLTDLRSFLNSTQQLLDKHLTAIEGEVGVHRESMATFQELAIDFRGSIDGLHQQHEGFIEKALGELKESMATLLSDLDDRHKDSVLGQLKSSQEAYETSLGQHMERLEAVVGENRQATEELLETQKAALGSFSDLIVDLRLQVTSLFDRQDSTAAIEESLEVNRVQLQELRQLVNQFRPAVLEYHQHFQTAMERALAGIHDGVKELLADFHRQEQQALAVQVGNHQKTFDGALGQHQKTLDEALEQHRKELLKITTRHQEALAELAGVQGTALQAFSDMVVDVHSNLGPLWDRYPAAGRVPVQRPEPM